tara:strand:- start:1994 stop:3181 length:1188 start_codon:yes stop_codon:yes gene_type:complete
MSEIRVDNFKAEDGISAPSFPNGIQVTGVITATVLDTSVDFLDVGSNIKAGNSGILTVTELKATNVSVAGTLTYEDVTNVDSIGVVTARTGLKVTSGEATVGSNIKLGNAGVVTATAFHGSGASLTGIDATALKDPAGNVKIQAQASGAVHTGIHTFSTVNTTTVTGDGSGVTNINASNIASGTIASARVPTLNQNTTGSAASAGSLDVGNVSSNSTYYPMFVDNNGSAKSVYIDNGTGLTFNPSTNVLTAGTVRGIGTVEVHGYNLSNAGDVGHGSNYWAWNMTPTIPWNKCILGHTGAHRASNDTHYYWYYSFNKGNGFVDQITVGVGRAHMQTTHNQGGAYTGIAMESNGNFMSGNANVQCSFKMYLSTGGNSAPASDNGYDHHAWAMFIHS